LDLEVVTTRAAVAASPLETGIRRIAGKALYTTITIQLKICTLKYWLLNMHQRGREHAWMQLLIGSELQEEREGSLGFEDEENVEEGWRETPSYISVK
jgi:hypothetical protein